MKSLKGRRAKGDGASGETAFTLIELLVAMTILMIIVMIVAQVFQQARQVWDTGTRKAEMNMKGRSLADFMAQELSLAVRPAGKSFSASGSSASFWVLGDADAGSGLRAARQVNYTFDGSKVKRDGQDMCEDIVALEFIEADDPVTGTNLLPLYVDVRVTVSDGGSPGTNKVFESRALMTNRKRYSM